MTQREVVLHHLLRGPVCGTTLLKWRIPRYAARIAELRTKGYDIVTETCTNADHTHGTRQVQYRIRAAEQLELGHIGIRLAVLVATVAALCAFLVAVATGAAASEEGDVACVTVAVSSDVDGYDIDVLELTEGAGASQVGHYLWLQYAYASSSTANVVSENLYGWEGRTLTLCTTYVAQGTIPTGPDSTVRVEAALPGVATSTVVAVASALAPHPHYLDAWVTASGLIAQ